MVKGKYLTATLILGAKSRILNIYEFIAAGVIKSGNAKFQRLKPSPLLNIPEWSAGVKALQTKAHLAKRYLPVAVEEKSIGHLSADSHAVTVPKKGMANFPLLLLKGAKWNTRETKKTYQIF